MEYEEGQQQTIITPVEDIALPIPETTTGADVADEEKDLPHSKITPLDTTDNVPKKRKRHHSHSTGLLEEEQHAESSKKLQELLSDAETFKQKELELLTELGELRKAAETSAVTNRDLEQKIEQERSRSDMTAQAAEETERQAAIAMANNKKEIERLRLNLEATNVARAEEILVLQRENESGQTRIRELEEMLQNKTEADLNQHTGLLEDIQNKEREINKLRKKLLANKKQVNEEAASVAEKASRLKAAETRAEQLEKHLKELSAAKEEERRKLEEQAVLSEKKMNELQTQLEQQKEKEYLFHLNVEANKDELRENFKREKEMLQKELEEVEKSHIAATQIAEETRKESERIKASIENANRLAREAEERRVMAEKKEMEKTNELQEIQRNAKEESERLNREKHKLINTIEDFKIKQERLEKEKQEAMVVERYETAASANPINIQSYIVSEVTEAMSTIQNVVMSKNQMLMEEVTDSIKDLKHNINSSGQELANRQDYSLAEGIRRFGNLIKNSMEKGDEIQEAVNDMIKQIDVKMVENQASVSNAIDMVKRLEELTVKAMDHDNPSDTNNIKLTWNFIKQSLISTISTAYREMNNLLKTVTSSSSAIRDKEYVESAKKEAKRVFHLLIKNKELDKVLTQLGIKVTFPSGVMVGITFYDLTNILDLDVEVESVGNDLEDNIKTIKTKISMAFATYREIETILLDVRAIAVQFANTERQFLREIESSKTVAHVEDSTASRLYYELDRFYLFVSTIENAERFQKMVTEQPLFNVFKDAIRYMVNTKDNQMIMEFLKKKGYNINKNMEISIDRFLSEIMGVELNEFSEGEHKKMDEYVFMSTMIGNLAIISEVIQKINNKIQDDRKQDAIKVNQMESRQYFEEQVQNMVALQIQQTQNSIAAEIDEIGGAHSSFRDAAVEKLIDEIKHMANRVEKHSQDIDTLINSSIREAKDAYESTLDILKKQYEEKVHSIQTNQQHMFDDHLRKQNEQQEYMQHAIQEKEETINMLQHRLLQHQDQTILPLPSTPSRGPVLGNGSGASGERENEELHDMEVIETGHLKEDKSDRIMRELMNELTEEKTAIAGDRNIKMFLKPEKNSEFVEVELSSKDNFRNINTEGLKQCLPDSDDVMKKKRSSCSDAVSKNNTLTGKIFLDTLKDKVFPYSSKSALEDEDGPAVLHHPEYFRSSFSKHFMRDSTSFTEPLTFLDKSESVRNFTRLLEYSLFNDTARGARSDNNMLSRLIYVVFEHDAKMIRYLSDITYKFREYATRSDCISLSKDRGNLLEATIASVFSAALPMISSMAPRIAEAVSEPVYDDVRIRSTYSLLSLIEKFTFCAAKRVHVLKNVLEKSGLVNRLSLYPADANANKRMSFDVQYDYNLLRMMLELMTINITNLVDSGIRPLKAVIFSIGTFTGEDKTRETVRAYIPIDENKSVLSKLSNSCIDVPKTLSVVNYLSAVTNWYVANRFNDKVDKESLKGTVDLMCTLLKDIPDLTDEFNTKLNNATNPSDIVKYVSGTVLPKLNKTIEDIAKKTKSDDAILVKGASEVGSLGEEAMNVSLSVSREHFALPWLEVDFRGGVDDSTVLWVLSGGVNSDEVVRDYQLAVPLYSSTIKRSTAPLYVKPLMRIINNTSGSDNVFLTTNNNKKTPGEEKEGGGGDRVHVVNLTKNVSCVLEYSTKDRYEAIINKMYRDGLVLVKGVAEVPRVFPTLDGKWIDNSKDNRTFTPLSVSRWKMPSASLVYGMLSKNKTKEEEQNQNVMENKKKNGISAPSVIDFMGGRAGDVLLKMLTLPSEQPIVTTTDSSSFDVSSTNKGLWRTNRDGYTSIDAQSMARLISDDKRPINNSITVAAASSSMAVVPYSDAANVVVNDPLEVFSSNNSWWIKGIQPSMRRNAATLSAVQEHLYFVQTPIF